MRRELFLILNSQKPNRKAEIGQIVNNIYNMAKSDNWI